MPYKERANVCPPSHVRWLNSPLRNLIHNPKKIMGAYVHLGDTVIDLGCGGGFFTVALAKMVGKNGRVIAIDLQEEMLAFTRDFAAKHGVIEKISLHQCSSDHIGLADLKANFALAFYVVHEVPDRERFLQEVAELLLPEACFLMIEPKHHVKDFDHELRLAEKAGFQPVKQIKVSGSKAMLFRMG